MLTINPSAQIQVTQDQVASLEGIMRTLPQSPGFVTDHHFAGGMYCRRMEIPAGSVIVSKVHKTEHLFIGCSGELHVAGQGESYILRSGDIVPSPVGTKRVVFAATDVVCLTLHKTEHLQATDDMERDLMESDGLSLFDVNNQPKQGVLVAKHAALED